MVNLKAKAGLPMKTKTSIKENGRITWLMEMDALLIHKEELQMDIGSTIYKMDLARRLGSLEK